MLYDSPLRFPVLVRVTPGTCGSVVTRMGGDMFPRLCFAFHAILILATIFLPSADNLSYASKSKEVTGIAKAVGQIPCAVGSFDDVAMILWFKDFSGSPIYSYDARNETEPRRHSTLKNEDGLRLYFRVSPSTRRSPALLIRDLKPEDAGTYRCRVDYRNSPTTNSLIRLKIVEPPTSIEIRDTSRFRLISDQQMVPAGGHSNPELRDISYLGPYVEGQNVTLVCISHGGKPLPQVIWYVNERVVDESFEGNEEDVVTNELEILDLGRRHSDEIYTCQAWNHNDTKKISHRVNLDVYLKAKQVELEVPDQMIAGTQYQFVCKTIGAYPSVKIELYKVKTRIGPKYQVKSDAENATALKFPFKPEMKDDESYIFCRAENPWIVGEFIEVKKKLHVFYAPVAVLRYGSTKSTNFSEGESVLLECHVKANPELHSINWYHEGQPISDNRDAGIIIGGFTLMLMHLTTASTGKYFCEAINDVGKGQSNNINLFINIAPRCNSGPDGTGVKIAASIGEVHQLKCDVVAWPSDLYFFWTLSQKRNNVVPLPRKKLVTSTPGSLTTSTPTPQTETLARQKTLFFTSATEKIDQIGRLESVRLVTPNEKNSIDDNEENNEEGEVKVAKVDGIKNLLLMGRNKTINTSNFEPNSGENSSESGESKNNIGGNEDSMVTASGLDTLDVYQRIPPPSMPGEDCRDDCVNNLNKHEQSPDETLGQSNEELGIVTQEEMQRRKRDIWEPHQIFRHNALLSYEILSEDDYGIVACWARNSYGKQLRPCLFHIIPRSEEEGEEEDDEDHGKSGRGADEGKLSRRKDDHRTAEEEKEIPEPGVDNVRAGGGVDIRKLVRESARSESGSESRRKTGHHVEEDGESGERGWSKLRGTLRISIILIGVLIFIGSLIGSTYILWKWKRKLTISGRGRGESRISPGRKEDTSKRWRKSSTSPSPSFHNDPGGESTRESLVKFHHISQISPDAEKPRVQQAGQMSPSSLNPQIQTPALEWNESNLDSAQTV